MEHKVGVHQGPHLPPGDHVVPFTLVLPPNIPSQNIYIQSPYYNIKRETSTQLLCQLVSDTDLLMSGQPSPSTASSSKVLRVVTSDFQNFHLTANKVCDWMKILLSKYYTEETKPFNLYLFKKIISGSL